MQQHPATLRAMQALGPYLAGARPAGLISPHNEGLNATANAGLRLTAPIFLMRLGNLPFFLLCLRVVMAVPGDVLERPLAFWRSHYSRCYQRCWRMLDWRLVTWPWCWV